MFIVETIEEEKSPSRCLLSPKLPGYDSEAPSHPHKFVNTGNEYLFRVVNKVILFLTLPLIRPFRINSR